MSKDAYSSSPLTLWYINQLTKETTSLSNTQPLWVAAPLGVQWHPIAEWLRKSSINNLRHIQTIQPCKLPPKIYPNGYLAKPLNRDSTNISHLNNSSRKFKWPYLRFIHNINSHHFMLKTRKPYKTSQQWSLLASSQIEPNSKYR